jgi:hypothetical protein
MTDSAHLNLGEFVGLWKFARIDGEGLCRFILSVVASGSAMCGGSREAGIQICLFDKLDARDYATVRSGCSGIHRIGGYRLEHAGTALLALE